jgi:hypothetical protein
VSRPGAGSDEPGHDDRRIVRLSLNTSRVEPETSRCGQNAFDRGDQVLLSDRLAQDGTDRLVLDPWNVIGGSKYYVKSGSTHSRQRDSATPLVDDEEITRYLVRQLLRAAFMTCEKPRPGQRDGLTC